MTITYSLAADPFWFAVNLVGTAAGGAQMFTKRSLDKTQDKAVYMDAGGNEAWTNPVPFDLNGVKGPFYWQMDSNDPSDTYYVYIEDAAGTLLWSIDNFTGGGGGGGGSNVTTYIPLTNYIANNQFINHIDDTASPANATNLVICPSNHKGFTPAAINPIVGTYGVIGPDIRFVKNSLANTDQITFPLFALASAPLTGDVTPTNYVRYQCTTGNAGEVYKAFQFPITQKVKNLSNQAMTFKIWAAVTATPVTLTVYVRQYFGSGTAASAEVLQSIGTITLSTTWTQANIQFTVPDVSGKSIGNVGQQTDDDAMYIQLGMPLNAACDVLFTKPKLYLGTINPSLEFDDYDQIQSITETARTADIKSSLLPTYTPDWLPLNDGTIGQTGSGASLRANQDTFQLYTTLYTGVNNTYCPVSGGRTGSGATMTEAITDFLAGKTLKLPLFQGRVQGNTGQGAGLSNRVPGETDGSQTVDLNGGAGTLPNNGAFGYTNMQPTTFMNFYIKL